MTAVDNPVREFSIAFYWPTIFNTVFFLVALAATLAAGTWLAKRFYLHRYGILTEGTVKESLVSISRVKSDDFSASTRMYTYNLTIQFTGPDGVKRIIKGKRYTSDDETRKSLQVGGKVPVYYNKTYPGIAAYYDPLWHYIVPVASLVLGIFLTYMAGILCYNDIRISNSLSLTAWTEEHFNGYRDAMIESSDAIYRDKSDAAAYERRGDAQFATVQYSEAIADYSEALRLQPDRRELLLKRAKAEWLAGRDRDALRDWLKSR